MSAVYIQFAPVEPNEGIAVSIRKWSCKPFEGGVEYAPITPLTDAAPDLLAAVIELLVPLERAAAEMVAYGMMLDEAGEAAFGRARAAIAKATQP